MSEDTILFWTMIGTCATAAATVGLLVGAFMAWRAAKATLQQMKHDSIAQTRPYLYATLAPSLAGAMKYDVLVENTGASTARNVRIHCSDSPGKPDAVAEKIMRFLDAVHTIPPRARLRNYWRLGLQSGHHWADGASDPVGMPEKSTLTIDYQDDEGRNYQDTFVLDTVSFMMAPLPSKGPDAKDSLAPEQKDTHRMLGVIAAAIGELRR